MASTQSQLLLDATAYLEWEAEQSRRHEYVAGEVFAMTGATDAHVTVALNLASLLRAHVRGTPCRVYMADMKLRVEAVDAFFYPDLLVTCSDLDHHQSHYKSAPVLIVEVLSESTAAYHRGRKFAYYRNLLSLQEYVLIDPVPYSVDLFRRQADGRFVLYPCAAGERIELASVGTALPIEALYEDVDPPDAASE